MGQEPAFFPPSFLLPCATAVLCLVEFVYPYGLGVVIQCPVENKWARRAAPSVCAEESVLRGKKRYHVTVEVYFLFTQLSAGFAVYLDLQGSKGSHPADSI